MVFDRNSNGDNTTDPEVTVLVTDKTTERSQLVISPIFSSLALNHASTIYLVLWYHHDLSYLCMNSEGEDLFSKEEGCWVLPFLF
jgi:hypothetical protein